MPPKFQKKLPPNAVAIQLVGVKDFKNYCVAYDLKDGSVWKKFELQKEMETDDDWTKIYEVLMEECPPKIVKSIFVNMYNMVSHEAICPFMFRIKTMGKERGYSNFNWSTNLVIEFVTELLEAKKKGKRYSLEDHVVVDRYPNLPSIETEVYLLKKQEIGWDVVAGTTGKMGDLPSGNSKPQFIYVRDIFVKLQKGFNSKKLQNDIKKAHFAGKLSFSTILERTTESLEPAGEYLAKVYAGEEFFNDYDCFLTAHFNHLLNCVKQEKQLLITGKIDVADEVCIVTLAFDPDCLTGFKIEKDNEDKTLVFSNQKWEFFTFNAPTFVFAKNYCSVDYYKHGLSWKLKDVNGNIKIAFKISFDKEIYIGAAAVDHPEFLIPETELEKPLIFQAFKNFFPKFNVADEEAKEDSEIILKTFEGYRKILPANLVGIFVKSSLKLLEEKVGKSINKFRCTFLIE
uniref:Uncharacterized protein n=1 Tax=Panagrolaimus sp. JU765 TaxID=591449 RepID=A0AC34RQ20_9BILA